MPEVRADRAVVLGGSIAGLLAARVLGERYGEVVVVERDAVPARSAHRRGVPQGRHIHALLAAGQRELEKLLPGLTGEVAARGAPVGDVLGDARWYVNGHLLRRTSAGLTALSASRPLLEGVVRERVAALPGVTLLTGRDIMGLASSRSGERITGARVLRRSGGSAQEVLEADLVVDATGRGSRAPVWLEQLGYRRPRVDRVAIGLGYASRLYRLRPGALDGDLAVLAPPSPAHPRGGALAMLEDGCCIVTLAGVLGDHPPGDTVGYAEFARSLHHQDIHRALAGAEPLSDPATFRFPASVRRRYESLPRLPDGLLALGDSVCSFNPVYGQGMSVAALEAGVLQNVVRSGDAPCPRRWFREVSRVLDAPWELAAGGDLAFPGVPGPRARKLRLMGAYVERLHAAAAEDARLGRAFVRVTGLVDRPETLLSPGTVARVLRGRSPRLSALRGA